VRALPGRGERGGLQTARLRHSLRGTEARMGGFELDTKGIDTRSRPWAPRGGLLTSVGAPLLCVRT